MTKPEKNKEEPAEGVLVSVAKTIGKTAGKIAAAVGGTPPAQTASSKAKASKLPKKNKTRLPRKQKKAAKKAATRVK